MTTLVLSFLPFTVKKINVYFSSVAIDLILFKLEDKKEMHYILDVFQFWSDWTTINIMTSPCLAKISNRPWTTRNIR